VEKRNVCCEICIEADVYFATADKFTSLVTVTVTGWYRTRRPMQCGLFLIYFASPSEF
jgi:hypothetical protein